MILLRPSAVVGKPVLAANDPHSITSDQSVSPINRFHKLGNNDSLTPSTAPYRFLGVQLYWTSDNEVLVSMSERWVASPSPKAHSVKTGNL